VALPSIPHGRGDAIDAVKVLWMAAALSMNMQHLQTQAMHCDFNMHMQS